MSGFITGTSTAITGYYYCDKLRYYPNLWGGRNNIRSRCVKIRNCSR
jgi:hypothetical protein